jgi:hypothetical protein
VFESAIRWSMKFVQAHSGPQAALVLRSLRAALAAWTQAPMEPDTRK